MDQLQLQSVDYSWLGFGWTSKAGDQGFKGSKKEGPGHFMVSFGGGLYVVRFWVAGGDTYGVR